jgi:hypothetical protein
MKMIVRTHLLAIVLLSSGLARSEGPVRNGPPLFGTVGNFNKDEGVLVLHTANIMAETNEFVERSGQVIVLIGEFELTKTDGSTIKPEDYGEYLKQGTVVLIGMADAPPDKIYLKALKADVPIVLLRHSPGIRRKLEDREKDLKRRQSGAADRVSKGKVLKVSSADSIQINIGNAEGVKVGDKFIVYRTNPQPRFVGVIEVTTVDARSAIAKQVMKVRGYKISAGDDVMSEKPVRDSRQLAVIINEMAIERLKWMREFKESQKEIDAIERHIKQLDLKSEQLQKRISKWQSLISLR